MSNFKKLTSAAFSYEAIIGKAYYVKGTEVWIVNTTRYTRTTSKHQFKLKQQLTQESKEFIPITTHIYTLNSFTIGDESSLKALFETIREEMTASNAYSLEKIANLLGIPFDKDAYWDACKEKFIEELLQAANKRPVSVPRWVKNFNPFIYSKLKILNAAHRKAV